MKSLNVLERVTEYFVNNEIISQEDKELYSYGMQQGLVMLLNIATSLLIGILLGKPLQSIVFLLAYIPIRIYAGGYHLSTQVRCYLFSIVLITLAIFMMKYITWTGFVFYIVTPIVTLIILILAPVEDENKPISQREYSVYKIKVRRILTLEIGLILLFNLLDLKEISICILVSLIVLSGMLIVGRMKLLLSND